MVELTPGMGLCRLVAAREHFNHHRAIEAALAEVIRADPEKAARYKRHVAEADRAAAKAKALEDALEPETRRFMLTAARASAQGARLAELQGRLGAFPPLGTVAQAALDEYLNAVRLDAAAPPAYPPDVAQSMTAWRSVVAAMEASVASLDPDVRDAGRSAYADSLKVQMRETLALVEVEAVGALWKHMESVGDTRAADLGLSEGTRRLEVLDKAHLGRTNGRVPSVMSGLRLDRLVMGKVDVEVAAGELKKSSHAAYLWIAKEITGGTENVLWFDPSPPRPDQMFLVPDSCRDAMDEIHLARKVLERKPDVEAERARVEVGADLLFASARIRVRDVVLSGAVRFALKLVQREMGDRSPEALQEVFNRLGVATMRTARAWAKQMPTHDLDDAGVAAAAKVLVDRSGPSPLGDREGRSLLGKVDAAGRDIGRALSVYALDDEVPEAQAGGAPRGFTPNLQPLISVEHALRGRLSRHAQELNARRADKVVAALLGRGDEGAERRSVLDVLGAAPRSVPGADVRPEGDRKPGPQQSTGAAKAREAGLGGPADGLAQGPRG